MNLATAKAIVLATKEHELFEGPIPQDEDILKEEAENILEDAKAVYEKGSRGKAIMAVLFAAEVVGEHEGEDYAKKNQNGKLAYKEAPFDQYDDLAVSTIKQKLEAAKESGDFDKPYEVKEYEEANKKRKSIIAWVDKFDKWLYEEEKAKDPIPPAELPPRPEEEVADDVREAEEAEEEIKEASPGKLTKVLSNDFEAKQMALAKIKKDNLPVPEELENDTLHFPRDFSELTFPEMEELLVDITACLSLATWRTSLAQIDHHFAERIADNKFSLALRNVNKVGEDGKSKNVPTMEAEASSDPEVEEWREREFDSLAELTAYKSLKEVYKGQFDAVSRVFSMRQEEKKRS